MVDHSLCTPRRRPLLIEDLAAHGRGLPHRGEETPAGEGGLALWRLQAFEQIRVQGGEAQPVVGDERLEALAGGEGHLVAVLLEPDTQGYERLDVSAATDGQEGDVHELLTPSNSAFRVSPNP